MNASRGVPKAAPDLLWRLLDDNAVVVSPRLGEVRVLNRVGTVIWQNLMEGSNPADIEEYLVSHFDVSRQEARSDLETFFNVLAEKGVLVWEPQDQS